MHKSAAVRAAREVVLLLARLAVDENAQRSPLVFLVLLAGDAVCKLRERVEVLLLVLARIGVGHRRGGRADALGVDKGEHRIKAHLLAQRERVGKVLLRLAGEAHDDVCRDDDVRHIAPRRLDLREVFRAVIVAVHLL